MNTASLRRYASLGFFALPVFAGSAAQATTYYTASTTISATVSGVVWIGKNLQGGFSSPTVSLTASGKLTGMVTTYSQSHLNIAAGIIGSSSSDVNSSTLNAYQTSSISLSGGTILNSVNTLDTSAFTLTAGLLTGSISCMNNSVFTMSGGVVGTAANLSSQISGVDSAKISVTGGTIYGDLASSGASLLFSGGSVSGQLIANGGFVTYSGGSVGSTINVSNTATLDIRGANLSAISVASNYPDRSEYEISGKLTDNSVLNNRVIYVQTSTNASFQFNGQSPVITAVTPAPNSLIVSLLGCGGIGWLLRRKR